MKNCVLLGKNLNSFLLSLALFERNKKVILVDTKSEHNSTSPLYEFEKVILKTWGIDCNVPTLLDLEGYLKPGPYRLIFDGVHLSLGNFPAQNYNEILRKYPSLLSSEPLKNEKSREKFDRIFLDFCETFGMRLFRYIDQESFSFEAIWKILPIEIKEIFNDFKKNSRKEEFKFPLCFFQGIYHRQFTFEKDDFSLLFVLLYLLSPRFDLNLKELEADFSKLFKNKGGEFLVESDIEFESKGSEIRQLSVKGSKPHLMEKLFLTSGEFQEFSLVPTLSDSYTSLKFHIHFKKEMPSGQEFFISDSNRLGGNYPLTRIKLEKDFIEGEVIIPYISGSKISFDEGKVMALMTEDLKTVLGELLDKDIKATFTYTRHFWGKTIPFANWPYFPKKMKNFNIFHRSNGCNVGSLSLLAQIKDVRGHLL